MNTFVNLNISPGLLYRNDVTVLNAAHDLVLETNETYSTISLKGRRIACVVFCSERDYLPKEAAYKADSDSNMAIVESDFDFKISFFAHGGVFNYVIEKSVIDDVLCFELDGKKITLSKDGSVKIE